VPIIVVTGLINGVLVYLMLFAGWGLAFFAVLFSIGEQRAPLAGIRSFHHGTDLVTLPLHPLWCLLFHHALYRRYFRPGDGDNH